MMRNNTKSATKRMAEADKEVSNSSILFNHLASYADSYRKKYTYVIAYRDLSKYMDVTFNQMMDMISELAHVGLISYCPYDRSHIEISVHPQYVNNSNYKFYQTADKFSVTIPSQKHKS